MNKKIDDHNKPDREEKAEDGEPILEDRRQKTETESQSSREQCDCGDCECEKRENTDEYKEKYIRALADYQNLSKRIEREREEIQKSASEWVILKLLPVLDDLELAKENTKEKGIELIYNKLWNILEREGVKKIEIKEDDEFDPSKMECIDAADGGKKLITVRSGYIMKGKILRPAQVKVIKT